MLHNFAINFRMKKCCNLFVRLAKYLAIPGFVKAERRTFQRDFFPPIWDLKSNSLGEGAQGGGTWDSNLI